jgi:hypothetical protein
MKISTAMRDLSSFRQFTPGSPHCGTPKRASRSRADGAVEAAAWSRRTRTPSLWAHATLRAPNGGSFADNFAETIAEVSLIRKAAFQCDLTQRAAGYDHQVLSARDSHSLDILTGRIAKARFEDAVELAALELRDPRKILRSDLCVEVNGYITLDAARLPQLHEIATSRRQRPLRGRRVDDRAGLVQHGSSFRYSALATLALIRPERLVRP